jgi:hypothetical protein
MVELGARAYDMAAWRFRCPRRDMNFPDVMPATARSSVGSPSPSAMSA